MSDQLKNRIRALEDENADLQKALAKLRQKLSDLDKFVLLGRLTAGIAHEINTPIGALRSNNDLFIRCLVKIRNILSQPEIPESIQNNEHLQKLLDSMDQLNMVNKTASERITAIVGGIRTYARNEVETPVETDINALIEQTLPLLQHEIKNRVTLHRNYGKLPMVTCYPQQISQVFLNLLVNASQAIEGKGDIFITTTHSNGAVEISIRDTGSGITPENMKKIFQPGFTTKGIGAGMGLGLSLVQKIINSHNGNITVESRPGNGATFKVRLPVAPMDS